MMTRDCYCWKFATFLVLFPAKYQPFPLFIHKWFHFRHFYNKLTPLSSQYFSSAVLRHYRSGSVPHIPSSVFSIFLFSISTSFFWIKSISWILYTNIETKRWHPSKINRGSWPHLFRTFSVLRISVLFYRLDFSRHFSMSLSPACLLVNFLVLRNFLVHSSLSSSFSWSIL